MRLRHKTDLRGGSCHCPPGLPLHLVHSEGIRETADVVIDYGSNVSASHRPQVPVARVAGVAGEIGRGDIVHVKSNLLGAFLEHVFPRIAGPIVLVTGDADFAPVARFAHLLDHPNVIHWFAQNCDVPYRHPRLTRIPIGFDNPRYTKLEKRLGFLGEMVIGKTRFDASFSRNDIGDQALLQAVAATRPASVDAKAAVALCTFHMNRKFMPDFERVADRREAFEALRDSAACHFVAKRLDQQACWHMHGAFAFEISPCGKGLDTFRTWEALFLNTIPIVKTTTLDPLYEDEQLPVVIVPSYREVTGTRLAAWKDALRDRFTPEMKRKLTNDYWTDRILAAAAPYR